jgi:sugar phosphate isomerase/epimerase
MKIGMVSDSLAHLKRPEMLKTARAIGIEGIEFNTGNWSSAPHLDLAELLQSTSAREEFAAEVRESGLEIIALNCNGNQLHPVDGVRQDRIVRDTIRLSGLLGLDTVCLMSGLPAAAAEDRHPNWIVSSWPPENGRIVQWQWQARLLPYWKELVTFGADHGVSAFAIEMHGAQLVYSPRTLVRLREAVGPAVCANLDPSHLMWMGADPLASIDHLGPAIRHVHGKDTSLNKPVQATATALEDGSLDDVAARSWSYCTIGIGHDLRWWSNFCYRLRIVGYDGWISIEHEDLTMSRAEGLRKSIDILRSAIIRDAPDHQAQPI